MKNLIVGVQVIGTNARQLVDGIVAAEQAGIQCDWMISRAASLDPLAVYAAATLKTKRILFGTSIIPTFPRHPIVAIYITRPHKCCQKL